MTTTSRRPGTSAPGRVGLAADVAHDDADQQPAQVVDGVAGREQLDRPGAEGPEAAGGVVDGDAEAAGHDPRQHPHGEAPAPADPVAGLEPAADHEVDARRVELVEEALGLAGVVLAVAVE